MLNKIEQIFEAGLWYSRFFVILAVVFGLIGAIVLFIVASVDIYHVAIHTYDVFILGTHPEKFHESVVSGIIGAVDLYLIAVVMLLFSFGLYELFISEIDIAKDSQSSRILEIHSLDQLKDKIAKVIIMVLVVSFFQKVMHTDYNSALEMIYFSASIAFLSLGLYLLNKAGSH